MRYPRREHGPSGRGSRVDAFGEITAMNKFRILAIDGGGIRGIVPGQILANLEAYLQKQYGQPGLRLADCFDLIAGTSTGGILTCIYLFPDPKTGRPQFSAQQAVDLYLNHGDDI